MGFNADDIVQVTYLGRAMGQVIMMVRNYVFTGAGIPGQTVGQATALLVDAIKPGGANDAVVAAYMQCQPTNYQLEYVKAQVIKPIRYAANTDEIFAAGTWPSTANVPNDSAAVILRTALAGRSQRGVVKVGPIPTDAAVGGMLTAAYLTSLEAFANTLDNPMDVAEVGGTFFPVIYHPTTGTKDAIATHEIRKEARTMSRRTVGRGI